MTDVQNGLMNNLGLMLMKRTANRPKDRLDIEALEKILRGEDPNA